MYLFKFKGQESEITETQNLSTPLGDVISSLSINGFSTVNTPPNRINRLSSKTEVTEWNFEGCKIELLKIQIIPNIPSSMSIQGCYAYVWRVLPTKGMTFLEYNCYIQEYEMIDSDNASGEGLLAQTFTNSGVFLTIGTEDEEKLLYRALNDQGMPKRIQNALTPDVINYTESGLRILLPPIEPNELIQIQFIVAWSDTNDSASWFAVDQKAQDILQQAGCA